MVYICVIDNNFTNSCKIIISKKIIYNALLVISVSKYDADKILSNIMAKLGLEFNLEDDKFQLGICKFDKSMRDTLYKNPHCIEYFCIFDNCKNCSQCYKYLKQKIKREAKRNH